MAAVCGKEDTIMANTNTKNAPRGTKIKESFGSRLFDIVDILIVCLLLACVLIPLIHIVAASFSNPSLFVGHKGILLWPEGFSLASYQAVFKNTFLWTGYANTLFIVIVGTVLNVLLSMVAAYCLSCKHVAAGPTIMKLLVFTMYFSGGMIPLYLVVKGVGLYGSRWALILPTLVDTYNLIIMRTAFAGVPDSPGRIRQAGRRQRVDDPVAYHGPVGKAYGCCHHTVLRGQPLELLVQCHAVPAR